VKSTYALTRNAPSIPCASKGIVNVIQGLQVPRRELVRKWMNVRKIRVKTEAPVLMQSETINATAEMGIWVWTAKPPSTTANKFNVKMVVSATAYPKQLHLNAYAPLGLREPVATKLLKKIVKTSNVCLILAKMVVLA
jgi:hypothetical protein